MVKVYLLYAWCTCMMDRSGLLSTLLSTLLRKAEVYFLEMQKCTNIKDISTLLRTTEVKVEVQQQKYSNALVGKAGVRKAEVHF